MPSDFEKGHSRSQSQSLAELQPPSMGSPLASLELTHHAERVRESQRKQRSVLTFLQQRRRLVKEIHSEHLRKVKGGLSQRKVAENEKKTWVNHQRQFRALKGRPTPSTVYLSNVLNL